jgi:hypothetical protein
MAITSERGEDIWQDFQEDHRAGDWKANSQVFDWAKGSGQLDIVKGLATSETKEETSKAQSSEKMMLVQLDWLTPHQGTA